MSNHQNFNWCYLCRSYYLYHSCLSNSYIFLLILKKVCFICFIFLDLLCESFLFNNRTSSSNFSAFMDEKKIFQQKILARVLMVCSGIILITSYLSNRMDSSDIIALIFMFIGIFTMHRAKRAEEKLKN
jgi:uncharacterized membrane protein